MANEKRFRVGKDAHFRMRIKTNGEVLSLSERDISVELTDPLNRKIPVATSLSGNIITFDFPGTEQKVCGTYRITIWENRGKVGETAADVCNAFVIVPTTCKEMDGTNGLDDTSLNYDVSLEVITKCGIYSESVRYLNVVTQEEYDSLPEHNAETLYIIK